MTTTTAHLADSQHPWIGLVSFTEGDREFFAGRGEEIDELLRLVRRDILTLLYGVSGLGKTSLLQAGLFPALRTEDCLPVPIRLDYREGAAPLSAQVLGAIIAAADAAQVEAPKPCPGETLWDYLHREGNHFWSSHNDLVTPFLVFDQFEEFFTLGRETPECAARSTAFISELADLVENRPPAALRDDPLRAKEFSFKPAPLKVLLAMREDYLADLDRVRSHFRALGQNRLRLLPMGERQARQVIALGEPLLAPGVGVRILKFVAGGDDNDAEFTIAPALLSLALRELNERRLARGPDAKITPDLLDVEQQKIFEDFYLRTVQDFPVGVRTFIEDKLLTTTGYRDSSALDDALSCPDVTQPILNELVNRRLLAYEDRHRTRRVELTHDVLIPVIKASRDTRLTREALAKARFRLAILGIASVVLLVAAAVFAILYQRAEAERAKAYIKVWKVGSPHTGDLPSIAIPRDLESEATKKGRKLRLEAFPAKGFAEKFFEAFEKHEPPDILTIDNYGIIEGIKTPLGTFKGVGTDERVLQSLIHVTDSLKALEGPRGGWEFLIATSRNYEVAKSLALRAPGCDASKMESLRPLTVDLNQIVAWIGSSYFKSAAAALQPYEDSAYLSTEAMVRQDVQIGATMTCGYWGNDHLAFVPVILTFQTNEKKNEIGPGKIKNEIGSPTVLLILRKQLSQWTLLTATTDPISTGTFMRSIPRLANLLNKQWNSEDKPVPAKLLAPENGQFPQPIAGQRFGNFIWQPSTSTNVVAEIVEFKYLNDARLFIRFRSDQTLAKDQISTGSLWTTRSLWEWRVWSISDAGAISLSESRSFRH